MAEKQTVKITTDDEFTRIFDSYRVKINKITQKSQNVFQNSTVSEIATKDIFNEPTVTISPVNEKPKDQPETNNTPIKIAPPAIKESEEIIIEAKHKDKNTILEKTINYTDMTRRMSNKRIGDILVESKIITPNQLQNALEMQRQGGGRLGEILVKQGLLKYDVVLDLIGKQLGVPIVNLKGLVIEQEVLDLVPENLAKGRNIIPVEVDGDKLVIVMGHPEDIISIDEISSITGLKICIALGNPSDIEEAIFFNYQANKKLDVPIAVNESGIESNDDDDDDKNIDFSPVAQNVNKIINQAVRDGASDIHIEPYKKRLRIRLRIDGILQDKYSLPISANEVMLNRIKILSKMNIAERHRPQDGQFTVKAGSKFVDIRVATVGTAYGERATLRILDKSLNLISLDMLGFLPNTLTQLKNMLKNTFGMILVGGPTGSGKTTTLYSMINYLNRQELNIMTIEDPIEYNFADITQMQVNEKMGIDFTTYLKSSLRHDPDVILIGEIRDPDTARIAVQATLTGHLVLASIHASDVSSMMFRLIHLGIEPYLISSTLTGLLAQRLVRCVCPSCSEENAPSEEESKIYQDITGERLTSIRTGKGCIMCSNSGFHGRAGIYELLGMNDTIRSKLMSGCGASEIRKEAIKQGMVTMSQAGMKRVKAGLSSINDVLRSTYQIT
jgi:type IV pilus assembly protein PilB